MTNIREMVKLAADSMKNRTLGELLKSDLEYQKITKEIQANYQLFKKLNLTEAQKNVVEKLIASEKEREYDLMTNSYMAGLLDGYEILKMFDLTKE